MSLEYGGGGLRADLFPEEQATDESRAMEDNEGAGLSTVTLKCIPCCSILRPSHLHSVTLFIGSPGVPHPATVSVDVTLLDTATLHS